MGILMVVSQGEEEIMQFETRISTLSFPIRKPANPLCRDVNARNRAVRGLIFPLCFLEDISDLTLSFTVVLADELRAIYDEEVTVNVICDSLGGSSLSGPCWSIEK